VVGAPLTSLFPLPEDFSSSLKARGADLLRYCVQVPGMYSLRRLCSCSLRAAKPVNSSQTRGKDARCWKPIVLATAGFPLSVRATLGEIRAEHAEPLSQPRRLPVSASGVAADADVQACQLLRDAQLRAF